MTMTLFSESELVTKCLQGNEEAWKEFYCRFSPKLYGMCLKYTKNSHDAKDLLQEGLIRAYRNLHQFNSSGSLEGWLFLIITNLCITGYKRTKKKRHSLTPITESEQNSIKCNNYDPLEILAEKELISLIQELPPCSQNVFTLYAIAGYRHLQIAEMLGISKNTSKAHYSAARVKLQKKLKCRNDAPLCW